MSAVLCLLGRVEGAGSNFVGFIKIVPVDDAHFDGLTEMPVLAQHQRLASMALVVEDKTW